MYLYAEDETGMNVFVVAEKVWNCCAKEKKQCLKQTKSELKLKSVARKLEEPAVLHFRRAILQSG